MIAQPAESSAQVRRLAEALVSMCQKYEPKTEEELAAFVQAKRVLASPEAPRGSFADACAELARLQEPVAPEIQATLDRLPVLDLAAVAPEAPARAWVEVGREGDSNRHYARIERADGDSLQIFGPDDYTCPGDEYPIERATEEASEWSEATGLPLRMAPSVKADR